MNHYITETVAPEPSIFATAINQSAGDDFAAILAFELLKKKHREKRDVRDKIIELADRRQSTKRH